MDWRKNYRQFLTAFIGNSFLFNWKYNIIIFISDTANISSIALGTAFGWTSPSVPKLRNTNFVENPIGRIPTDIEESWIGSLLPLGASIGVCIEWFRIICGKNKIINLQHQSCVVHWMIRSEENGHWWAVLSSSVFHTFC